MKLKTVLTTSLGLLLLIVTVGCKLPPPENKLNIAVASNMQFAMEEIADAFMTETNIPCELIVGASGQLTAQIKEGAPFNVLVSADMKYPLEIEKAALAANTPQVYAYGKIVIWTLNEDITPTMEGLLASEVKHIAIANPKLAPYGVAAQQALKYGSIFNKVKYKLVYGESITQTNQFILSQSAEAGITAKSIVTSPKMRGVGSWRDIDPATYDPIEQGVVIIKKEDPNYSKEILFCKFLTSEPAQKILRRFGYAVNE